MGDLIAGSYVFNALYRATMLCPLSLFPLKKIDLWQLLPRIYRSLIVRAKTQREEKVVA